MNYIQQINAFNDFILYEQSLSSGQVALWYTLMSIDNRTGWKDPFTATNQMLESLSGLSRPGILKARNMLKQFGLITFQPNGRNKATSYHIKELCMVNSYQQSNQQSNQQRNASGTQQEHNSTPIPKHKPKQTKSSSRQRQKRVYDEGSDYMKLARYLFKQMQLNDSKAKEPNFQSWADEMRKLVELDKRDKHEVSVVIKWCQHDSFWSTVILSAKKLRAKFSELLLKMNAEKGQSQPPEPPVDPKKQAQIDAMHQEFQNKLRNPSEPPDLVNQGGQ